MAEIKTALISYLMRNEAVFTMFGNRITVDKIPDNQLYPHAKISTVADEQYYHHGGPGGRVPMVQIDVYGDTSLLADNAANVIRNSLDGYRGQLSDLVNAGRVWARIITSVHNEDTKKFRRIVEVEVGTND